jgi:hypothetical protein
MGISHLPTIYMYPWVFTVNHCFGSLLSKLHGASCRLGEHPSFFEPEYIYKLQILLAAFDLISLYPKFLFAMARVFNKSHIVQIKVHMLSTQNAPLPTLIFSGLSAVVVPVVVSCSSGALMLKEHLLTLLRF